MTDGSFAVGVVLHVKSNGSASLGSAADVVELEAHEGFNQGTLAIGLVADHKHRRSVERSVELLGEAVKLIVSFVESPFVMVHRQWLCSTLHFRYPFTEWRASYPTLGKKMMAPPPISVFFERDRDCFKEKKKMDFVF